MEETHGGTRLPVEKSSGITDSERYLEMLCEKDFLSLWSYPRPFRDQGGGKEICDLLVVMGDDVVIFSDKHCVLELKKSLELDWARWFRAAVAAGAKQAWGAERWLREHPDRVFLDPGCTQRLPVRIPTGSARYHLVVTVHGVSAACQAMLGGTGSLMMKTDARGLQGHGEPFVIGDLDPDRSFVHVFDDATLDFVLRTLDTAPDVLRYLRHKEELLRSRTLFVAGEENLLAHYLTHVDDQQQHAFDLPDEYDAIGIDESLWDEFERSDERRSQIEADRVSYAWDQLIEKFGYHALRGTQYYATAPGLQSSETILRFMAAEPRLRRRYLADALLDALRTTPRDQRRIRVIHSPDDDAPLYVFVLVPWNDEVSEDENRTVRRNYLEAVLHVARLQLPEAMDIVGIATESGPSSGERTEDAFYFDTRSWSAEDEERAKALQQELSILVNAQRYETTVEEYPISIPVPSAWTVPKNPRNKPCPCGSGRKYKQCHGATD